MKKIKSIIKFKTKLSSMLKKLKIKKRIKEELKFHIPFSCPAINRMQFDLQTTNFLIEDVAAVLDRISRSKDPADRAACERLNLQFSAYHYNGTNNVADVAELLSQAADSIDLIEGTQIQNYRGLVDKPVRDYKDENMPYLSLEFFRHWFSTFRSQRSILIDLYLDFCDVIKEFAEKSKELNEDQLKKSILKLSDAVSKNFVIISDLGKDYDIDLYSSQRDPKNTDLKNN